MFHFPIQMANTNFQFHAQLVYAVKGLNPQYAAPLVLWSFLFLFLLTFGTAGARNAHIFRGLFTSSPYKFLVTLFLLTFGTAGARNAKLFKIQFYPLLTNFL